jgi:hypothetical protein
MGYSEDEKMGWKMYIPELKEPELSKMRFEMAKDESTVETFEHFVGVRSIDDESHLEYETTRIAVYKGLIVAYRAPVNTKGKVGFDEKAPTYMPTWYECTRCQLPDLPTTSPNSATTCERFEVY